MNPLAPVGRQAYGEFRGVGYEPKDECVSHVMEPWLLGSFD